LKWECIIFFFQWRTLYRRLKLSGRHDAIRQLPVTWRVILIVECIIFTQHFIFFSQYRIFLFALSFGFFVPYTKTSNPLFIKEMWQCEFNASLSNIAASWMWNLHHIAFLQYQHYSRKLKLWKFVSIVFGYKQHPHVVGPTVYDFLVIFFLICSLLLFYIDVKMKFLFGVYNNF